MRWFDPSALSGLALISLSLGVIAVFIYGLACGGSRRQSALSKVVVGAVGFQVFHFLEHGLQLGYWFFNTKQKPWLTPWAQTGVDGLAFWCQIWPGSGTAGQRGAELLHLVGNTIFLVGVLALFVLARERRTRNRSIQGAVLFQGLHFLEHILLTATVFVTGRGWGASTMFGRWSGSELSSHRVWWHFTVNAIATAIALSALVAVMRSGALLGVRKVNAKSTPVSLKRYFGLSFLGLAVLQILPFILGSVAGDPAPRVRNLMLLDVLSPGSWWHLVDPYVLIPVLLLVAMWKMPKHARPVPSN
jgi:hypothetical protein